MKSLGRSECERTDRISEFEQCEDTHFTDEHNTLILGQQSHKIRSILEHRQRDSFSVQCVVLL